MELMWLLMRATGLVAAVLLTVAVVIGLIAPTTSPTTRLVLASAHRAAGAVGSILILGHVGLAVVDRWVAVPLVAAVVPGVSEWEPVGVALGTLAVDLLIVLVLSAVLRTRIGPVWRRIHLLAFPVWILAITHALVVGTDGSQVRWLALASMVLVLASVAVRLLRPHRSLQAPAGGAPAGSVAAGVGEAVPAGGVGASGGTKRGQP